MCKPAMLAALSLLLLALAACGAAEPAQTADAAADTSSPEPVSWEGPGECYKAEPIETPEGAWPGCTQEYDGEICSLISTENGTLRVMRGSRSLLEPEGSRGYFMRCDENGCWLVTGGLEGVALRLYDFEGKKLLERALDEAPRSMLLAGGRAWLDFGDGIVVYGPDGSKEEIGPEGEYLGVVADRKGGVQLIRQEGEKLRITPIEGGEGFLTENGVLGCGDGSAFLYLAAADGLYRLSDSGKARLLIDFAACKMEFFGMSAVSSLDDGRFMCTTQSGEVLLRPATPYELRDRTVLKAAVFNAFGVKDLAAQFNAQNPDYELKLVDYVAETGSVDQALTRMSAELGAGDGPDMVCFERKWELNIRGAFALIRNGLLEDLTPYIDAEPELGREQLMAWDALNEYGGVYYLGPRFAVDCMMGLKENFEGCRGMSMQEYLDMEAALEPWQDMCSRMDPEYFLELMAADYLDRAMDWETGSCDFDNAEFVSILEAAARVEDDRTQEHENVQSFETAWSRMGRGQLMLSSASLGASAVNGLGFDEYWTGKELSYFGYPSPDGTDGLSVQLATSFGVNVNSQHKEACWEFLSWLLRSVNVRSPSALPLYRPLFDELIEYQLEAEDIYGFEDRAAAERMCAFVESADSLSIYDDSAMDIILEEAGAYFAGAQSAEQTAEYVQNRMSIYVAEQS